MLLLFSTGVRGGDAAQGATTVGIVGGVARGISTVTRASSAQSSVTLAQSSATARTTTSSTED